MDSCWNILEAKLTELHKERKPDLMRRVGMGDMPHFDYRLLYLERLVTDSLPTVTPEICTICINHAARLYPEVLNYQDLETFV